MALAACIEYSIEAANNKGVGSDGVGTVTHVTTRSDPTNTSEYLDHGVLIIRLAANASRLFFEFSLTRFLLEM